jgi:hypothetical protein
MLGGYFIAEMPQKKVWKGRRLLSGFGAWGGVFLCFAPVWWAHKQRNSLHVSFGVSCAVFGTL